MRCWNDPARAETRSLLLHPPPRSWWPTRPKGLMVTRLGGDEHTVIEGVAEVVVPRGPTRVEDAHREDGPVPGQDDETAAVSGERKEIESHVEIQGGIHKRRVIVMGKRIVVRTESIDLPQEHPEVLAGRIA